MNVWDILILAAVAALIGFAWMMLRRSGRKGCPGCCEGCARSCGQRETDEGKQGRMPS